MVNLYARTAVKAMLGMSMKAFADRSALRALGRTLTYVDRLSWAVVTLRNVKPAMTRDGGTAMAPNIPDPARLIIADLRGRATTRASVNPPHILSKPEDWISDKGATQTHRNPVAELFKASVPKASRVQEIVAAAVALASPVMP
jgi:hypothetical protein